MFNQYDLIRWQAQEYNKRLEALYVAPDLNRIPKPSLIKQVTLLWGRLLSNASAGSNTIRRDAVHLGHEVATQ